MQPGRRCARRHTGPPKGPTRGRGSGTGARPKKHVSDQRNLYSVPGIDQFHTCMVEIFHVARSKSALERNTNYGYLRVRHGNRGIDNYHSGNFGFLGVVSRTGPGSLTPEAFINRLWYPRPNRGPARYGFGADAMIGPKKGIKDAYSPHGRVRTTFVPLPGTLSMEIFPSFCSI